MYNSGIFAEIIFNNNIRPSVFVKNFLNRFFLVETDFTVDSTVVTKNLFRFNCKPPVKIQTIFTTVQCMIRFMIAYALIKRKKLVFRYVRWIADNKIKKSACFK